MSSESIADEKGVIDRYLDKELLGTHPITKETTDAEPDRGTSALSRIASRLSTRDIVDPGPPPDGGIKAWTQVLMGVSSPSTRGILAFRMLLFLSPVTNTQR